MIKKLSQRVFFLILISLSIIILGVIILFAFLNYNNTINSRTTMMERFIGGDFRRSTHEQTRSPIEQSEPLEMQIEGVYHVVIENSNIIASSNESKNDIINKYALEVCKSNRESGIIGDYIYKVRRDARERNIYVMLMEDKDAISHIKAIFLFASIIGIISLIMVYIIAKKISNWIVRPVEKTFEKQKQFISDASHELKTPLAVIEANADVLENEVGKNKWLAYIQNEIESMNKLINELLLLAKLENIDKLRENNQMDLSKEIEIIVSMFESMAYEKKVKLISNIGQDIIFNGNKEDIEHILSTLIDNAIKHTEKDKDIIVELNKNKNEIILQVKNMGTPIPDEEKEKIFERFYRIDKSRNRNEKRYGLGLSIAKATVEKYKGKIEVLYKDGFTIFKVTIPI